MTILIQLSSLLPIPQPMLLSPQVETWKSQQGAKKLHALKPLALDCTILNCPLCANANMLRDVFYTCTELPERAFQSETSKIAIISNVRVREIALALVSLILALTLYCYNERGFNSLLFSSAEHH